MSGPLLPRGGGCDELVHSGSASLNWLKVEGEIASPGAGFHFPDLMDSASRVMVVLVEAFWTVMVHEGSARGSIPVLGGLLGTSLEGSEDISLTQQDRVS